MFLLPMLTALMTAHPAAPPVTARDERAVHHYVRSNSDGSEAEDVVVFRRAPDQLSVIKLRGRCTSAAHVTARIDPTSGAVLNMVGGRLQRDGGQLPMAWLGHDAATGRLTARVGSMDAPPMFDIAVGSRWHLYDFDFADLVAHPPAEIAARTDFAFDLPLLLVGDNAPTMTNRGAAHFAFEAEEQRGDSVLLRYRIGGPAFGDLGGTIWFAAQGGHPVEARIALPNHSEYRDFHLRLIAIEQGEAAWLARIDRHWNDCPAR